MLTQRPYARCGTGQTLENKPASEGVAAQATASVR